MHFGVPVVQKNQEVLMIEGIFKNHSPGDDMYYSYPFSLTRGSIQIGGSLVLIVNSLSFPNQQVQRKFDIFSQMQKILKESEMHLFSFILINILVYEKKFRPQGSLEYHL